MSEKQINCSCGNGVFKVVVRKNDEDLSKVVIFLCYSCEKILERAEIYKQASEQDK